MFKNCCVCPSKKLTKSKSYSSQLNNCADKNADITVDGENNIDKVGKCDIIKGDIGKDVVQETNNTAIAKMDEVKDQIQNDEEVAVEATRKESIAAQPIVEQPFKRRQSNGILKSTTSYSDESRKVQKRASITPSVKIGSYTDEDDEVFCDGISPKPRRGDMCTPHPSKRGSLCGSIPRWISQDEDDVGVAEEGTGTREPPATPVGRDELELRRHRFFSELMTAAQAAVEHRVRFDPLGPIVADGACDPELHSSQGPAADLDSLISRLERVTTRLERALATPPVLEQPLRCADSPPSSPPAPSPPPPLTPPPQIKEEKPAEEDIDMSVAGFQDIVQGPLQTFISLSQKIGGDVATHSNFVQNAFAAQLQFLQSAAGSGKPSQTAQIAMLTPTSQQISAIQDFREKNRTSPFFNHLSAISESIPALGWVTVSPAPSPYVKEMNDAGQFYTNRVLKEWKEKDKTHVEWCRAWVQLLQDLQAYVKQHHTTGLVWSGSGAAVPPPPPGGMPPPPPCLPPVDFSTASAADDDDRSALFAQINQGEDITKSLKKVTSEMQTHKNPTLRTGPAPFKAPTGPKTFGKQLPTPGAGQLPDKPPVFARDGKKWLIEYQKGNQNLIVENPEMNNVVYMFRCRDSALTIKGKMNGVVLDSCTKCAVVFDNLVSSVEFVNCQSVQMQVLGKVPTISVDKTDGCQMYLSNESLDVEIVSSKSSEMNVLVPKANGDYTEFAIPEQFKTMLNKPRTGLNTLSVENKG